MLRKSKKIAFKNSERKIKSSQENYILKDEWEVIRPTTVKNYNKASI